MGCSPLRSSFEMGGALRGTVPRWGTQRGMHAQAVGLWPEGTAGSGVPRQDTRPGRLLRPNAPRRAACDPPRYYSGNPRGGRPQRLQRYIHKAQLCTHRSSSLGSLCQDTPPPGYGARDQTATHSWATGSSQQPRRNQPPCESRQPRGPFRGHLPTPHLGDGSAARCPRLTTCSSAHLCATRSIIVGLAHCMSECEDPLRAADNES